MIAGDHVAGTLDVVPPTVSSDASKTATPSWPLLWPLLSGPVPWLLVPMKSPSMRSPLEPAPVSEMPSPALPEMTLPAPVAVPPMRLFGA